MTGFPDVLLHEILDYLDLHELLCLAMPVSRFWRSSAIEHPRYWRVISLDQESMHERRVHSSDLFFLRLARAGAKPVDLRIWMMDPAGVLDTLARELYHIRRLTIRTQATHSNKLFDSMRHTPAPILQSLVLSLMGETASQAQCIAPEILFGLHSPVLSSINFSNVALPSDGELPTWLANAPVRSFIYESSRQSQQLPNLFASWPRLETLSLGGFIEFIHPAFLHASTWAGLEFLGLYNGLVRRLPALPLPLAHIPRIWITDTPHLRADELVFIADVLMNPGPLAVTLDSFESYLPDSTLPVAAQLTVVLRCLPDAGKWRGRWVSDQLPQDAPGRHPEDFVTALQHAPLLSRIVSLCVSLESWDTLVGRGYLAQFPAVEDLALTLGLWFHTWRETWHAPAPSAKLEVPRLRRVAFKYKHYGPSYLNPVLQLSDLAEFITAQLSGARLPLHLMIEGVKSRGEPEEFAGIFNLEIALVQRFSVSATL